MAFKQPDEAARRAALQKVVPKPVAPPPPPLPKSEAQPQLIHGRLVSIDAFRGLTMLALASGGFAVAGVVAVIPH